MCVCICKCVSGPIWISACDCVHVHKRVCVRVGAFKRDEISVKTVQKVMPRDRSTKKKKTAEKPERRMIVRWRMHWCFEHHAAPAFCTTTPPTVDLSVVGLWEGALLQMCLCVSESFFMAFPLNLCKAPSNTLSLLSCSTIQLWKRYSWALRSSV